MENKKLKKRVIFIIGLLIVFAITYFVGTKLTSIVNDVDGFKETIESYGAWGYVVYVLLVTLQVILAFIPGGPFQMAGGYAFGTTLGTILATVGCTLGSMIVFVLVRKFGRGIIELFISEKDLEKTKFILDSKRSNLILAICFIIPGTPKDAISYIAGLTTIPIWQWFLICSIGRVPGIIFSAIAGDAIYEGNLKVMIMAIIALLVISVIGAFIYKKVKQTTL